jgi:hypothetical protein
MVRDRVRERRRGRESIRARRLDGWRQNRREKKRARKHERGKIRWFETE